jgi:HK97 family phage major capsid protein
MSTTTDTSLCFEKGQWETFEQFTDAMHKGMRVGGNLGTLQAVQDEIRQARSRLECRPLAENRSMLASEQRRLDKLSEYESIVGALVVESASNRDALVQARRAMPQFHDPSTAPESTGGSFSVRSGQLSYDAPSISVGNEESVYRPDTAASFFRDLAQQHRDPGAAQRLMRHYEQTLHLRTVTTGDPGAVGLVPPTYLGQLYAQLPRVSKPFADALPSLPLPDSGTSISIPRVTTGTSTAVMATEASTISNTDMDTASLSVPVVTIAGVNDVSLQALERTAPGLDLLVFQDLQAAYDATLETQLFSGTGSNGQHRGLSNVASIGSITYTSGSPTGVELVQKVLAAVSTVATTRHRVPDAIVMHPRRAAWLAGQFDADSPVLQSGSLFGAAGTQASGFAGSISGVPVITSAAITTTAGASTNEDVVFVCHRPDMPLMQGGTVAELFRSIGGTESGIARLRLYGYSAFASGRAPTAICTVTGTGLAATLT